MKIGILSDIHSNIFALKACTQYMEQAGCTEYFLLGDFISDTPYTRETLDYLYNFISKHSCHVLRGNREEYMLSQLEDRARGITNQTWVYNSACGNLLYSYEQLTDKDFKFFKELPITFTYQKEGYPSITCCHGSPKNTRDILRLNSEQTQYWLDHISSNYLICAHTHEPGKMSFHGKQYLNTGCIGIAIKDYGFAQCLILNDCLIDGHVEWKPTFLKIPYDNKQVVMDILQTGMLHKAPWFMNCNIQVLLTGIDRTAELVQIATALEQEETGSSHWPLIDEIYFERAAKQLNVPDYRELTLFDIFIKK